MLIFSKHRFIPMIFFFFFLSVVIHLGALAMRHAVFDRKDFVKSPVPVVYIKHDLEKLKGAERVVLLCEHQEVSCHWMVISSICQSFMRLISENGQPEPGTGAVGCMG